MVELLQVLIAQVSILVICREELLRIAYDEIDVCLHGQRHGEIVDVLRLLGCFDRLVRPRQGLQGILQARHLCQAQIDAHRELLVTVAHLLESLFEVGLPTGLVVAAAVDVAIESCGEIVVVAGFVLPDLFVQGLGILDGTIDLIMPERKEALVAQQLVIEHHIALLMQFFGIVIGKAVEFFGRAVQEQVTEHLIPVLVLTIQVCNSLVCVSNCGAKSQKESNQQ